MKRELNGLKNNQRERGGERERLRYATKIILKYWLAGLRAISRKWQSKTHLFS